MGNIRTPIHIVASINAPAGEVGGTASGVICDHGDCDADRSPGPMTPLAAG